MNANLQDAEPMVAMGDSNVDSTTEADPGAQQPGRNSPASAVCYQDLGEAQTQPALPATPTRTIVGDATPSEGHHEGYPERAAEDTDSTPRSEVPSVTDGTTAGLLQQIRAVEEEPSYFCPQPLRLYSSNSPRSSSTSTDPSPTASANASSTTVDATGHRSGAAVRHSPAPVDHFDRPNFLRDLSNTSTSSVATVRANSVDPIHLYTPPSRQRDGPQYPNQAYAALHNQQYPAPHQPPILRARSSHPAHFSGHSISGISTFGLSGDHHRDIMESGSRTVGNSPASSPGLFSPTTPPLRQPPPSDDNLYSTPWLHYTHRQAPKETHIADVDVDPVSGRKLINQYEVIDELGRGVHGKVKLGRDLVHERFVAIKIVDRYSKRRRLGKNTSHEDKIKREIAILKKARHPNIVSLIEVIDDPSRKKVYIVLEHVKLGEVKWRVEGAKEVCLVEWRRFKRESEGIFDNESAVMEDEKIIKLAHQKLERQQRRRARESHRRRQESATDNEPWSFEHGGDSEDEYSEPSQSSRVSTRGDDRPSSRLQFNSQQNMGGHHVDNMETAFRSTTPVTHTRTTDPNLITELEGTMYGAYDTELFRGRTPSLAGSSSSHFTDGEEEVPEHFRYVPTMTIHAAREAFRDTVLGLEYLHYQSVVHRDIKPANLLLTSDHRIKISDFGVSYLGRPPVSEDTNGDQSESDIQDADEAIELAKTVGTPAFYAPELCHTEVDIETPRIDNKIDLWALGVTLYCLIYGRVPFHDTNTFRLMKVITDTEPYIPRYRLKPVAEGPSSRPNSHGRMYQPMTSNRRAPHDLEYEEVDENLRDLLRHLFVKDPRRRISITEIKHHPWLAQNIDNVKLWVQETDPDRSSQGQKIEISKDDVDKAVVPITILDRVRSGVRKTVEYVTKGITRGGSRRRAQSSVSGHDPPASISANSSSSTISEGRRGSLGPGGLLDALGRSREPPEHPLSQSVTASPEVQERRQYFESPDSRTASPAHSVESYEHPAPLLSSVRPQPPERAYSSMSSAASIRTIRQTDMTARGRPVSPGIPPALPGTPTALDSPGGSNLGGIFGGVPRRIVNSVRSRERMLKPPTEHARAKSIDRLVGTDDDAHSVPSLAISTAVASGHVDQPDLLKELSPSILRGSSPKYSDGQTPDPLERASSRQSSISSISSRLRNSWAAQRDFEVGPALEPPNVLAPNLARNTSDERFSRAKDEFLRRRVREQNLRERRQSAVSRRLSSALDHTACPPSPDDESYFQRRKIEDYLNQQHSSSDTGPVSLPISINTNQPTALASSSSEDHFTSMSQSTSNPSIPSVASANSSVAPDDCLHRNRFSGVPPIPSGDSIGINQFDAPMDDPAGYDGDHALESEDDDDDESDDDDFIVMGKKKPPVRSESISNGELARSSLRKDISLRRRSARSGSNGTVKKIRPPGDDEDEKTPEPE